MARLRTFGISKSPFAATTARYHVSASPYSSRSLALPIPNANLSISRSWASTRHSLPSQPRCLVRQSLNLGQRSEYRGCRFFTADTRAAAPIIAIKVPQMAESISEGTLASLLKKIGDRVEVDDEIASIETDKVDVAVNTPEAGVIVEMCVEEGDVVCVDQVVCRIDTGMDVEQKDTKEAESGGSREDKRESAPAQKAARVEEVVRKDQASQQPDKSTVGATPAAQPSTASLTPQMSAPPTSNLKVPAVPTFVSSPPSPSPASNRPNRTETRVKMTRIRSTIAARLKESQNRAAALTTFNEVDMSALIALRQRHRASVLDAHGVRLGFMGAFAKASALALREVPAVNAGIEGDGVGSSVVWRDYVDISFAVSTEKGLVTPVLRNCESLSLLEMEKGIAALAEKARLGKITMQDLQGGNFTISNGGVFGSLMGTPIINLPQTAVMGLHGIKERPVAVDGKVEIRPMMYLALTYDHRLVDGKEATTFLVLVKKYIEDPTAMLLE